jgi:hypothetical protein
MHIFNDITRKFSMRNIDKFWRQNYLLFTSKKEIMTFVCCEIEMCLSRLEGDKNWLRGYTFSKIAIDPQITKLKIPCLPLERFVPELAYLRRIYDTKRVSRHQIRRMIDNTMVKRVTSHLIRRMIDNTMVKRVTRHLIRRMTDNTIIKSTTKQKQTNKANKTKLNKKN